MKTVGVKEARDKLSKYVDESNDDRVVIMNHGKPAALLVGLRGYDLEDALLMTSPGFWAMIERSRRGKTVSLADVRRRYARPKAKRRRR